MSAPSKLRRQFFVLTTEEKKIIACVLGALVIGLATQHYRATHPHAPPPMTPKQARIAKSEARTAAVHTRLAKRSQPEPSPPSTDEE